MNVSLDEALQLYAAAHRDMTSLDILIASGITLPVDAEALGQLNPYAVALRYEGSEVHWVTEHQAVCMVNQLNSFVEQFLQVC